MANASGDRAPGAAGAAAIVLALIALAYAGPIVSGERFYFRDVSQNHGPVLEGARALLAANEGAWWSPWAGGGEPLFANPNHLLFTPHGVIALALGAGPGMTFAALFGSLLGGLFLFLLMRHLGRSPWGAASGSLAFALSGYGLSIGSLPNVMAAVSWIPAALYFTMRVRETARWLPPAAIATAFVLAPCEPASALVLTVFAVLFAGRTAAGVLVIGAGAAAAQVLPAMLWIGSSARAHSGLVATDASKWALVLRRLPEMVVPGFCGLPERPGLFWGANLFDTGIPLILSLHVGISVLLLGILGIRGPHEAAAPAGTGPPVYRWPTLERTMALAGAGFLLLAACATPSLLGGFVPGASLFRYPEKLVLGTMLALALLVASGLDRLVAAAQGEWDAIAGRRRPGIRGELRWLGVSAAGMLLLTIVLAFTDSWVAPWFSLSWYNNSHPAAVFLPAAFGLGALEILVFLVLLVLSATLARRWAAPLLALSVATGLLLGALVPAMGRERLPTGTVSGRSAQRDTFGPGPLPWRLRANPSVPASFYASRPFFEDRLKTARDAGERVFRHDRPAGFAVLNRTGTLADGHQWDRRSLGRASASEFGVELAYDRSTDRLDPSGQDAALEFFKDRPLEDQVRFWSLASVRLVLAYRPLEASGLRLVDRVDGESNMPLLLYENERCLPRVRMTSTLRSYPASSDDESRARIAAAEGDAWQEPQIAPPEGKYVPPGALVRSHATDLPPVDTGRKAALVERRPGLLKIRIEPAAGASSHPGDAALRRPENLVIAENDVPGWRATLDGKPVRIARTNGMHMSVLIPDVREHEVVLVYRTPGLAGGAVISALALVLAVLRGFRRTPRAPAPDATAAAPAPSRGRRR